VILGTAGHVDHGKTALVRALTGVDTDRLPDEKRRGITIDLGFAPLRLDGLPPVSIVDVPGHEAFVRNMLAGATGVDLALLVIAADEGVMPQTREHLLILSLLGVSAGVVALTKADLVDDEWLALVRDDVAELLNDTPLASAPVIATSAVTGAGLDALREALSECLRARPRRNDQDLFRMPVDRVFSVRGTGTVVTGTVWSGTLAREASVRILPGTRTARVRALQSHGAAVDRAEPGARVAVALSGIDVGEIARGAVLVTDPAWRATTRWIAEVGLDAASDVALGPRTAVRLHLGTADLAARIVAPGGALVPGARAVARVVLDEPAVARAGDRFVLRTPSPMRTIGGGVVIDPAPARRRQRPTAPPSELAARLERLVHSSGLAGVPTADLPIRLGVAPAEVPSLIARAGVRELGGRLAVDAALAAGVDEALCLVEAHHSAHPLEAGLGVQELRTRLGGAGELVQAVLDRAVAEGRLLMAGAVVMRAGWSPTPTGEQRQVGDRVLAALRSAGREPPSVDELTSTISAHAFSMLKFQERDGLVVQVAGDRFYEANVLRDMISALREGMRKGRSYTPQEIRDIIGVSRKFLIPFLEYCDRSGVTERRADGRVLTGALRGADRQVLA
jgi:selenocysteine-specific elongation factor